MGRESTEDVTVSFLCGFASSKFGQSTSSFCHGGTFSTWCSRKADGVVRNEVVTCSSCHSCQRPVSVAAIHVTALSQNACFGGHCSKPHEEEKMTHTVPLTKTSLVSFLLGGAFLLEIYLLRKRKTDAEKKKQQQYAVYNRVTSSDEQTKQSSSDTKFVLFNQERRKVVVQVPATSANLGSGYDCIGMALDLWNELILERADQFEITVEGEGADDIPLDASNYVVQGVEAAFKAANKPVPPLKYHLVQRIPHGRGLGSSSAAIVAGLIGGLAIAGHKMQVHGRENLLQIATKMEGHPDNVAPAMYGGVQLGIFNETLDRWETQRLQLPHGLKFVMFIPSFVGKTEDLRRVVPKTIPLTDAVFNMGRLAWFINALNTNRTQDFKEGLRDRLHQPHRAREVYTHLDPLMEAAYAAGACGAYLSGAGPVVMAITAGGAGDYFTQKDANDLDMKVAEAMTETAKRLGVVGKVYITHPSTTGGVVVFADPPYSTPFVAFNGET